MMEGAGGVLVGLTGGIAAGKSSVARLFADLGAVLVDADQVAREVVKPGEPVLGAIVDVFGQGVLDSSGALDRAALAAIVFADPKARSELEAITHPAIAERSRQIFRRLADQGASQIVYEAALLVESDRHHEMDAVVVVVADDEVRVARLMARDGLDRAAAQRRIAAQLDQWTRAEHGDYVIDNSGTIERARAAATNVWRELTGQIVSE